MSAVLSWHVVRQVVCEILTCSLLPIFYTQVAMQDMLQMLTRSLGVTSSERVDNLDPSCRRPLRLLDQLFVMDNLSAVTQ